MAEADDMSVLITRLCARLFALRRVEVEILYPCMDKNPLIDSGSRMHDQVVVDLHAVLDAMVNQTPIGQTVSALAQDMDCLHRFEVDMIYPRCESCRLESIGERMVQRRIELLDNFLAV